MPSHRNVRSEGLGKSVELAHSECPCRLESRGPGALHGYKSGTGRRALRQFEQEPQGGFEGQTLDQNGKQDNYVGRRQNRLPYLAGR